jgi:hypothetical protein
VWTSLPQAQPRAAQQGLICVSIAALNLFSPLQESPDGEPKTALTVAFRLKKQLRLSGQIALQ